MNGARMPFVVRESAPNIGGNLYFMQTDSTSARTSKPKCYTLLILTVEALATTQGADDSSTLTSAGPLELLFIGQVVDL